MRDVRKRATAVFLAAALSCAVGFGVVCAFPSAAHASGIVSACESDAVLVTLADGADPVRALAELASNPSLSGIEIDEVVTDDVVKLSLPDGLSAEEASGIVAGSPSIEAAQPNHCLYTQETAPNLVAATILMVQAAANDPAYAEGSQWGLSSIGASAAWDSALAAPAPSAQPVTVAVIDAGFYVGHEDLKGNVIVQYDATAATEAGSAVINPDNTVASQIDHGTHAAGIVAASTNNGIGVASVSYNQCKVLPVRVEDKEGVIYDDYLVKAYDYIVKNAAALNIRVVNMSLGAASYEPVTRASYPVLYDAIAEARAAGIVTVVAACNGGTGGLDEQGEIKRFYPPFYAFPSDFDNVVSVMALGTQSEATDNGVMRLDSSNYNVAGQNGKDISAPGGSIYGLYWSSKTGYGSKTGTSMAAPLVAGVLGLMFRANPDLTADQAVQTLYDTARDLTQGDHMSRGWDEGSGYGELDAAAALQAVVASVSEPAPDPEPAPEPSLDSEPSIAPDPEPAPGSDLEPTPAPAPDSDPDPEPTPDPEPAPAPDPEPTLAPAPDSDSTHTSDPEPAPDPEPTPAPNIEPTPDPDPAPSPESDPQPAPSSDSDSNSDSTSASTLGSTPVSDSSPEPTSAPGSGSDSVPGPTSASDSAPATSAFSGVAMSSCSIFVPKAVYTGKALKPAPVVSYKGVRLEENVDYTVALSGKAVNPGSYKVAISAAKGSVRFTGSVAKTFTVKVEKVAVYELYNKKTGQWFYTTSIAKRAPKLRSGWTSKGVAWKAPSKSAKPVYYRLTGGKISYTTSKTKQGIAFYSYGVKTHPVYRYYNAKTKAYRYSTSKLKSSAFKRKGAPFYAA